MKEDDGVKLPPLPEFLAADEAAGTLLSAATVCRHMTDYARAAAQRYADELAAEQRRAAMYGDLVRRTAEALGVTRADGWHDLPERAAALVAEREARGEPFGFVSEHKTNGPFRFQFHKDVTEVYTDTCVAITRVCTAPQPAIPEGWRLVPAEPTMEMVKAGWTHHPSAFGDAYLPRIWTAMLAAAPQPKGIDPE